MGQRELTHIILQADGTIYKSYKHSLRVLYINVHQHVHLSPPVHSQASYGIVRLTYRSQRQRKRARHIRSKSSNGHRRDRPVPRGGVVWAGERRAGVHRRAHKAHCKQIRHLFFTFVPSSLTVCKMLPVFH